MSENEISHRVIGCAIELHKALGPDLPESVYVKSIDNLAPVHFSQTLTYLKLADKRLALLINVNTKVLKEGIH